MNRKFKVTGKFDGARPKPGTVTIGMGLFRVRPLRRRREFILPLDTVADMVVARVIKGEVLQARLERAKRRKRRRRR